LYDVVEDYVTIQDFKELPDVMSAEYTYYLRRPLGNDYLFLPVKFIVAIPNIGIVIKTAVEYVVVNTNYLFLL